MRSPKRVQPGLGSLKTLVHRDEAILGVLDISDLEVQILLC